MDSRLHRELVKPRGPLSEPDRAAGSGVQALPEEEQELPDPDQEVPQQEFPQQEVYRSEYPEVFTRKDSFAV